MSIHDLFDELVKRYYIIYFNSNLIITNKFLRAFKIPLSPKNNSPDTKPVPVEPVPDPKMPVLIRLILDAKVPAKIETRDSFYWVNKYNKKADIELEKILAKGYKYDILMNATKLYYKAGGMPKTIANFILEGVWQSCYEELRLSLEQGNTNEYINKSLGGGSNSKYKL